ncbi:LamB porin family protein, putative [Citrifermentans bremense]|uniref:LamB porin family protein, putative n=1 Tax=Citrifermentans bremense TaxID=60035 RepID=A0A6S6M5N9_9BACT|nr:porin [Citrifermentans bremense]BCG47004.1 LamB porin family protein, putative [Citrifermentans bremense]
MKKKNKKLLVAAIATALSAASAVPALALENQFNGAFTAFYDMSNFSGSGVTQKDAPSENYFVQRVRLGYTAKADDHVKLVTKFEFDYNYWGNSSYTSGPGTGGAIGADSVNMETKHLYLDLAYPQLNTKIGMMPYNDSFKGMVFDTDVAGILLSHDYANASVSAGFFRLMDSNNVGPQDTTRLGRNTNDMFTLDGKYSVSKDLTVGAAYYYISDDSNDFTSTIQSAKVHNLGINAAGNVGPVALNGFFLKQFGDLSKDTDAKGYTFNVGAKMPLAGGTLRSEFLYVSGGSDQFYIAHSKPGWTEGGQFYDAEMTMLNRDKYQTTIDNAIMYDVANNGQGVIEGTVGYDYTFNDKVSASANAGFAAVAKNTSGAGSSDYLGTEVNAEAYYKLTANVTLGARAGYLFLGDYFTNEDNPYDVKLIAKYNF